MTTQMSAPYFQRFLIFLHLFSLTCGMFVLESSTLYLKEIKPRHQYLGQPMEWLSFQKLAYFFTEAFWWIVLSLFVFLRYPCVLAGWNGNVVQLSLTRTNKAFVLGCFFYNVVLLFNVNFRPNIRGNWINNLAFMKTLNSIFTHLRAPVCRESNLDWITVPVPGFDILLSNHFSERS